MSRRTARAVRIGAAALAAGLAVPAAAGAAPDWLATSTVAASDTAATPQTAVDAAGDALVAFTDDAGVVRAGSRAAGSAGSWDSPASLGTGTLPRVAMAPSGRAVVAYRDASGTITATTRDTRGGAWAAPAPLTASPVPAGVVLRVAIDAAGDAVVAWNTSGSTVEAAVRPAGGAWGAAEVLCAGCDKPALAIDADGDAVAAWVRSGRGESRIRPAAPGFVSAWSAPAWATPVNVTPTQPQLAMDGRGTTLMVFRDVSSSIQAVARPGSSGRFSVSAAWTAPQVISVPGESVDQPQVAMDAAGNAVAVWRHVSSPATVQASSRAADDPWSGWGAPQNLYVNGLSVAGPQVSMNAAGDTAVVWEQGAGATIQASVRAASAGPSAAFPAPRDLASGATAEVGPAVAVDPSGNAVAAWREDGASTSAVQAAGFDGAGPVVTGFTGPSAGVAGASLAFTFGADDVWSPLGAAAAWDFGDGGTATGATVSHTFAAAGTYTVTASRADVLGNLTTRTQTVAVSAPPPPPSLPPSTPGPASPVPATPAPATPAPAPVTPVTSPARASLSALAVRRQGRSWTAVFRLGARSTVKATLAGGPAARTLGGRTLAAGSGRLALGALPRGRYRLTVSATAGGRTVKATKAFTVA